MNFLKNYFSSFKKNKIKKIIFILFFLLLVFFIFFILNNKKQKIDNGGVYIEEINSFQDCLNAGYPVMESYPEKCSDKKNTFINEISLKKINCEQKNQENKSKDFEYIFIEKAGKAQLPLCTKKFTDAEKICQKSSQCLGDCMIKNPGQKIGKCQGQEKAYGCRGKIEENLILCID